MNPEFANLTLQSARHESGYVVSVNGLDSIVYEDDQVFAKIESDLLCGVIPLYAGSLRIKPKKTLIQSPQISSQEVLSRIKAGLDYLGIGSELSAVTSKPASCGHFKTSHPEGGLVIGLVGG